MEFKYFTETSFGAEKYTFIPIPLALLNKDIYPRMTLESAIIYSYLLDRLSLSFEKETFLDDEGKKFLRISIKRLSDKFRLSTRTTERCMARLKESSLLTVVRDKDLSGRNRIYINDYIVKKKTGPIADTDTHRHASIRLPLIMLVGEEFCGKLTYSAVALYSLLLNRMGLSFSNKERFQDERGRVYCVFAIEDIASKLSFSKNKIISLFKELDDETGIGLIHKERKGSLSNRIYVKDFLSPISELASIENLESDKFGPLNPPLLDLESDCDSEYTGKCVENAESATFGLLNPTNLDLLSNSDLYVDKFGRKGTTNSDLYTDKFGPDIPTNLDPNISIDYPIENIFENLNPIISENDTETELLRFRDNISLDDLFIEEKDGEIYLSLYRVISAEILEKCEFKIKGITYSRKTLLQILSGAKKEDFIRTKESIQKVGSEIKKIGAYALASLVNFLNEKPLKGINEASILERFKKEEEKRQEEKKILAAKEKLNAAIEKTKSGQVVDLSYFNEKEKDEIEKAREEYLRQEEKKLISENPKLKELSDELVDITKKRAHAMLKFNDAEKKKLEEKYQNVLNEYEKEKEKTLRKNILKEREA